MSLVLNYILFVLLSEMAIVKVLAICIVFFLVLLILGFRKSYKLEAENKRLMQLTDDLLKEDKKEYLDFTESHIYQKEPIEKNK